MTPIIHLYGMTFGHICTFNCIVNENKIGELKMHNNCWCYLLALRYLTDKTFNRHNLKFNHDRRGPIIFY